MSTLLITGVAGPLGRQMARLAADAGMRVLGVDVAPLARPLPDITFIQSDVRNPLLADFMKAEGVNAILHAAFRWRQRRGEAVFENNVLGTAKLLEAAVRAKVEHIIFPSSILVYGPGAIQASEEVTFQVRSRYAFIRHLRSIEILFEGFRSQAAGVTLTVLRFGHILGGGYPSPLARYLALPVAPTLQGHNPLMQVLHFDDAILILMQTLLERPNGIYNITAPEPQALYAMLDRCHTPHTPLSPLLIEGARWLPGIGPRTKTILPLPWEYLRDSLTVDVGKAVQTLGFEPVHPGEDVVRAFARELNDQRKHASFPLRTTYQGVEGVTQTLEKAEKLIEQGIKRLI